MAYWLSNIDELRCLFSSLDALLRKEARGIKSGPGAPKSLTKLLNDIHFLETELVGQFLKKAKESIEKMVVTAVLENEGLPGVKKPKSTFSLAFFFFFDCLLMQNLRRSHEVTFPWTSLHATDFLDFHRRDGADTEGVLC